MACKHMEHSLLACDIVSEMAYRHYSIYLKPRPRGSARFDFRWWPAKSLVRWLTSALFHISYFALAVRLRHVLSRSLDISPLSLNQGRRGLELCTSLPK
jgi:hypothetical protein